MNKILTVKELRKALKMFVNDRVITVWFSVFNEDMDCIKGIQCDVENWEENGRLIQLNISENIDKLLISLYRN